jgi:hypothetical protein
MEVWEGGRELSFNELVVEGFFDDDCPTTELFAEEGIDIITVRFCPQYFSDWTVRGSRGSR